MQRGYAEANFGPGEAVRIIMRRKRLTPHALATELRMTARDVLRLMRGDYPIFPVLADRLSATLGGNRFYWMTPQAQAEMLPGTY